MGRGRIIIAWATILCLTTATLAANADDYKPVGTFLLKAHFKLTGDKMAPIPMKPMVFKVSTDGTHIKVAPEGTDEAHMTFEIYRSDGIATQRRPAAAIEVIPGLQASSRTGGVLRHLRLSRESMTLTTFPSVSDQTIVSYAQAVEATSPTPTPPRPAPASP